MLEGSSKYMKSVIQLGHHVWTARGVGLYWPGDTYVTAEDNIDMQLTNRIGIEGVAAAPIRGGKTGHWTAVVAVDNSAGVQWWHVDDVSQSKRMMSGVYNPNWLPNTVIYELDSQYMANLYGKHVVSAALNSTGRGSINVVKQAGARAIINNLNADPTVLRQHAEMEMSRSGTEALIRNYNHPGTEAETIDLSGPFGLSPFHTQASLIS